MREIPSVRSRRRRRAVSEVVASVAMLAVTMAILGGLAVISLGSIRNADNLMEAGSQNAAADSGIMLTVVSTQSNSTGTYVWLFDYGWVPASLSSVYLDGGVLSGWSSSCNPLGVREMCAVALPPATHGSVSMFFGTKSLSITV